MEKIEIIKNLGPLALLVGTWEGQKRGRSGSG
jgi:hypothetical protein